MKTLTTFLFLLVKLLTTARTALDTYALADDTTVAGRLLTVALIDGVMLALWLYLAHAGGSMEALAWRPFAAAGAWALYLGQIIIGLEVHHGTLALIVRLAGGLALAYDSWGYIVALARRLASRQAAARRTPAERRAAVRRAIADAAYYLMVLVMLPASLILSGARVLVDIMRDLMVGDYAVSDSIPSATVLPTTAQRVLLSPDERRRRIAARLSDDPGLTVATIATEFGIGERTARRDLAAVKKAMV